MIAPITPHLAEEIFWHASARSGATGVGESEKDEMGRGPSVFTKPWTEMVCGYRSIHTRVERSANSLDQFNSIIHSMRSTHSNSFDEFYLFNSFNGFNGSDSFD